MFSNHEEIEQCIIFGLPKDPEAIKQYVKIMYTTRELMQLRSKVRELEKSKYNEEIENQKKEDELSGFRVRVSEQRVKGKSYRRWIASRAVTVNGKKRQMNVYMGKEKPSTEFAKEKIKAYLAKRPELFEAVFGYRQAEFNFE